MRHIRPMQTAPHDGTVIRLWRRDGEANFVGSYSTKWWGWVRHHDPCPLILSDHRLAGWQPARADEVQAIAEQPVIETPQLERIAAQPARIAGRIVTSRKPRPRT
jgi:hypothetical protein